MGGEAEQAAVSLSHRVPDLGALELLLAVARLGSLGAGRAGRGASPSPPPAAGSARWSASWGWRWSNARRAVPV